MTETLNAGSRVDELTVNPDEVYLASGSVHPQLAADIADEMGLELGPTDRKTFPNGELYVRYEDSMRGKHAILLQTHAGVNGKTPNDAILEHALMIDAAYSSSAREITVVAPHMAYLRQDRKTRGRESVGARTVLNLLAGEGTDRLVAVDMHSSQMQAITRKPFDHLTAFNISADTMKEELEAQGISLDDCIVVAPDAGAVKASDRYASYLGIGLILMPKLRDESDSSKIKRQDNVSGVRDKFALIFDDMIDTAGTITSGAETLVRDSGAQAVFAAATHGILSGLAIERLNKSAVERLIVTDTIPQTEHQEKLGERLRVVSIAPVIGEALTKILTGESVSAIFNDRNHS